MHTHLSNTSLIVLSARQVEPILRARREGDAFAITSFDLGRTQHHARLTAQGLTFPDGQTLSWHALEEIRADPDACWQVTAGEAHKIHAFFEEMQRAYSLLPTDTAPTLINAGFTMHRIKRSDPMTDTGNKIRAAAPVRGLVLDTTTGLGYTAIEAAKTARHVTTIEIDQTVLDVARLNPWSQALFNQPRITQLLGDSYEVVENMADEQFDLIVHDPPSLSLAGELYSGEFYCRLYRILLPGGRLFHYLGNPASKQGRTVTHGAIRRLKAAGFTRLIDKPAAFGVVAHKPK